MPNLRSLIHAGLTFGLLAGSAGAQPSRVLVVYNSSQADSLEVAQHYMSARAIPAANLCPVAFTEVDVVTNYATVVNAVKGCLTSAGSSNILYIVLSYLTPYVVVLPSGAVHVFDSYLADPWNQYSAVDFLYAPTGVHGYHADSQARGNHYVAFQPLSAYRGQAKAQLIYSVWRLDAPTKALAKALVDRAISAEALPARTGNGCFDMRFGSDLSLFPDQGYSAGDYDIARGSIAASMAGIPTINDTNDAEFGTAPAPLTCPSALLYTGWYSFFNYNDAFTWNPGAIGWHIDSASASDLRGNRSWVPNAISRGITVTAGAPLEPYLSGLPRSGGLMRNLFEGANVGDAFLRNTRWLKWRVLYAGDPLYRPFPGGVAPFNAPLGEASLRLSMRSVLGGRTLQGTVQLPAAAGAGGTVVNLASAAGITIPSTVTVPQGSRSASFPIGTPAANNPVGYVITATGPISVANDFAVTPLLSGVAFAVSTVKSGTTATGRIFLNERAPAGGVTISVVSNNAALTVPAAVAIPAGATYADFMASAGAVGASVPVTVNVTHGPTTPPPAGITVIP